MSKDNKMPFRVGDVVQIRPDQYSDGWEGYHNLKIKVPYVIVEIDSTKSPAWLWVKPQNESEEFKLKANGDSSRPGQIALYQYHLEFHKETLKQQLDKLIKFA